MARRPRRSHNGGPPIDDYQGPPWGKGDAYIFLAWRAAHDKAWKAPSQTIMLMRLERAERLGLTYEEYTLEILERGRHLGEDDAERIAEIRRIRRRRPSSHFE
ncbi:MULTISPECIES: hypothetical protein [unclassified Mesorhizobium]|uniref:hypothetical protein n=1 Tax=unclassified Mesorhizobium TaxID=325217 RepID=UPI000FCC152D|nr:MULTISPECIES: hypothetical protein [unclassified Mesorhizobium]TGP23232.1 hypothetical protein EN874_016785 [Mesorhizobium sp. M1D.F.Ca.ET.231.01.1.1]TGP32294.1 hypothetical protein EN877_16790 [Mesorhizobium sp. M1D.F.Ca.ET.234.01.1.1]TGS46758.1 hypothetical protein EN827_16785 [Mesorhizobium sp. M1D.F.Ca.ET.184.01.1.1]TGS61584.1 hypothetical protein EN826_016785 [Mesorhizobium sp. M1D.F.Ca.ET.183.01.1.1]